MAAVDQNGVLLPFNFLKGGIIVQNKLLMKYPTSWHGEMWREGAPFGNGLIGGLIYGGIFKENIVINHAFLWRGGSKAELPNISYTLPKIRQLLDEHKIAEADNVLSNTLREKGYSSEFTMPTSVCDIIINTKQKDIFTHYKREVDMKSASVTVSWQEGEATYKRCTFVSRVNNLIFTQYSCENGTIDTSIAVALHDTETMQEVTIPNQENFAKNDMSYFAALNISVYKAGDYGAVCKVFTDGQTSPDGSFIKVKDAKEILIVTKTFIETKREDAFAEIEQALNQTFNFDQEFSAHAKLHNEIFSNVDFSISSLDANTSNSDANTSNTSNTSNEELLLEAFEETASNELIEKLYAFGRYLFICSTSDKNTLPCHLTGLFNGTYQCYWAFNMYNVNFEMIYWQALSGNMPSFMRLALDYTEAMIGDFQENAKKTFGCNGILINSVNTPESGLHKCLERHILNWTGGAAWFSQHFWDYYRFTEDIDYLKNHALPFMYQTALFYEDFVLENADGYYDIYPSVSPENVASNLDCYAETAKNATMESALLKELLTNLISGCKLTGLYPEKPEKWTDMLSKIRPYMINEDGAIKEWSDDYYKDNYCHRHHSHIYPIFPGCEVTKKDSIYKAFEKAEDMRLQFGISDQSSWSVVFMSGIAARMERGDFALKLIDTISRTCLMNNFFTVHNDWRRLGPLACADMRISPFQIDANIGIPSVINEMLLQSQQDDLFILPALPKKWTSGHIKGLLARGNIVCDIFWNDNGGYAILSSKTPKYKKITLGSGFKFENILENVLIQEETRIEFIKIN